MPTPLLAISYSSKYGEKDGNEIHISMERKLKYYYLSLFRSQAKKAQENGKYHHDISSSDEDEDGDDFKDSISTPYHTIHQQDDYTNFESNKISMSKDYSKNYMKSHKIWTPIANTNAVLNKLNQLEPDFSSEALATRQVDPEDTSSRVLDDSKFLNYLHLPKLMGPNPLPSLIYHTSCEVNGEIFLLGGASTFFNENGVIKDLSTYVVEGIKLPKPINSKLLNNPTVIPNNHLFVISSETNLVTKPEISGDIPPPLLSMSASQITNRHIFYYGGFEIMNKIDYNHKENKIYIKKSVKLNNSGYVLDVISLKFKKFELIAHPNMITKYPLTVPRFGHSSCAVNLAKRLKTDVNEGNGASTIAATIFIMGGFRQDPNDATLFKAIRDLWKVELSITYRGKHDYVQFGENVLATPIPGPIDDTSIPCARAFHSAEIFDARVVHDSKDFLFGKFSDKSKVHNPNKIGIGRPSSPTTSLISQNSSTSGQKLHEPLDLKLMVHGGTDGDKLFGDVWWFDFDDEVWYPISTYFHEYDHYTLPKETVSEVQLKRAGHRCILIDKYFYIIGGGMPTDFENYTEDEDATNIPDISPLATSLNIKLKTVNFENDHYQRLFILNLQTQTWLLAKYFHGISPLADTSKSLSYFGNVGATVTQSNSKVFVVGGQLIPHQRLEQRSDKSSQINILNSGVSIFEFPLGGALAGSRNLT